MSKRSFWNAAALMLAGAMFTGASANASTMYSFNLSPTSGGGDVSGTLLLTLSTPIPASGNFYAAEGEGISSTTTDLTGLSIVMSDGDKFSLGEENGTANVTFFNDTLSNFSYDLDSVNPQIEIGGTHYDFSTNGNFSGSAYTGGTVTFEGLYVAPTPEPSSLFLLGTGILAGVGMARRRLAV